MYQLYQNQLSFVEDDKHIRLTFFLDIVLNKFATKYCERFPPHLNSVSTLPCKTQVVFVKILMLENHTHVPIKSKSPLFFLCSSYIC